MSITDICLSPEVGDDPKVSSSYKAQGLEMLAEVLAKVIKKVKVRGNICIGESQCL